MPIAKTAKFFKLHTVGMGFFVFGSVVIALFALCAGQRNFRSHKAPSLSELKSRVIKSRKNPDIKKRQ
jgi:hypothetical protein